MRYFSLAICLGLITGTTEAQDFFTEDVILKWTNAMDYTLELAEAMPAEKYDFKPTEEQLTFQEQLLHMAQNVAWLTSSYLDGEKVDVDRQMKGSSKAEVMVVLRKSLETARATLQTLDTATLDDEISFFAGPMRRRRIIFLLFDHLTHHRGQAVVYARLQGIKPPRYRGW
ncbi:MAG: DinB family protein [Saprospiraceae bacterium]|nr:DinB family protein [Saprospiraceae bacterium]